MVRLAGDIQVIGTVAFTRITSRSSGPLVVGRVSRGWPRASAIGVGAARSWREIESAEVGEARAALIAAKARYFAAEANLRRESELADKRISSARERELAAGAMGRPSRPACAPPTSACAPSACRPPTSTRSSSATIGGRRADPGAHRRHGHRAEVTLGQAVERATDAFKIADPRRCG